MDKLKNMFLNNEQLFQEFQLQEVLMIHQHRLKQNEQ